VAVPKRFKFKTKKTIKPKNFYHYIESYKNVYTLDLIRKYYIER